MPRGTTTAGWHECHGIGGLGGGGRAGGEGGTEGGSGGQAGGGGGWKGGGRGGDEGGEEGNVITWVKNFSNSTRVYVYLSHVPWLLHILLIEKPYYS